MTLKKRFILLSIGALVACVENNIKAMDASASSIQYNNDVKNTYWNNNLVGINNKPDNNMSGPFIFPKKQENGSFGKPQKKFNINNNIVSPNSQFVTNNFSDNKENNVNLNNGLLQNNESGLFHNIPYKVAPSFANKNQFGPILNKNNVLNQNNNFVQPNNNLVQPLINNGNIAAQQPIIPFLNKNPKVIVPNVNNINNNPANILSPEIGVNNVPPSMLKDSVKTAAFKPISNSGKPFEFNNVMPKVNNNLPFTFGNQQNNQQLQNSLPSNEAQNNDVIQVTTGLRNGTLLQKPFVGSVNNNNIIIPTIKTRTNLLSQNNNLYANKGILFSQPTSDKYYSLKKADLFDVELNGFDNSVSNIIHHTIWSELEKYDIKKFNDYMNNIKDVINVDNIAGDLEALLASMPALKSKRDVLLSLINDLLINNFRISDSSLLRLMDQKQYDNFDVQNITAPESSTLIKLINCLNNNISIEQFSSSDFKYLLDILDKPEYNNNAVVALLLCDLINKSPSVKEYCNVLQANIMNKRSDDVSEIKKHLMLSMLMNRTRKLSNLITSSLGINDSVIVSEWIDLMLDIEKLFTDNKIFDNTYNYNAEYMLVNKLADTLNVVGSQLDNKTTLMTDARNPMANILLNWHLLCKSVQHITMEHELVDNMIYASNLNYALRNNQISDVLKKTIGAWSEINGKDVFFNGMSQNTKTLNIVNMLKLLAYQINNNEDNNESVNYIQKIKKLIDPDSKHDFINDLIVFTSSQDSEVLHLRQLFFKYLNEHRFGVNVNYNTTLYHNNKVNIPGSTTVLNALQNIINNIAKSENLHIDQHQLNKLVISTDKRLETMQVTGKQIPNQLQHQSEILHIIVHVLSDRRNVSQEPTFYVFREEQCRSIFNEICTYSGIRNFITPEINSTINNFIKFAPSQIVHLALKDYISVMLQTRGKIFDTFKLLGIFAKYMDSINKKYVTSYDIVCNSINEFSAWNRLTKSSHVHTVKLIFENKTNELLHELTNKLVSCGYSNLQLKRVTSYFSSIAEYNQYFVQYLDILQQVNDAIQDNDFQNEVESAVFQHKMVLSRLQFINNGIKLYDSDNNSLGFVDKQFVSKPEESLIANIISKDELLNSYTNWVSINGLTNYQNFIDSNIMNLYNEYANNMRANNNEQNWTAYNNVDDYNQYATSVYDLTLKAIQNEVNNNHFYKNSGTAFLTKLKSNKKTIISVLAKSLKSFERNNDNRLFNHLNDSLWYSYCLFQVILSRSDNSEKSALLSKTELDLVSEKEIFYNNFFSLNVDELLQDILGDENNSGNIIIGSNNSKLLLLSLIFGSYCDYLLQQFDNEDFIPNLNNSTLYSNESIFNDSGMAKFLYS